MLIIASLILFLTKATAVGWTLDLIAFVLAGIDRHFDQRIGIFPTIWLAWASLLVTTVIVTVIPQVCREGSHSYIEAEKLP